MGTSSCCGQTSNRNQSASSSSNDELPTVERAKLETDQAKKHSVDKSNLWSFATFSWMSGLLYFAYRNNGLDFSHIPPIPDKEACRYNTDVLEQLWTREIAFSDLKSNNKTSFGRVTWLFIRARVLFTTLIFLTSLILGFIGPTLLMKRVLDFASQSDRDWQDGLIWVSLLILCELARVFFITLTWALSYRTALRLKTASMGLVYRKLFRLGRLNDSTASKLLNVINNDCNRMYNAITVGQVGIGGPVVLLLSFFYILSELGWLSLIGLAVFPLVYPLQYILARGSGSYKRKGLDVKDNRVTFISQATQHLKFLKMFAWEKYFEKLITSIRLKEKTYLQNSQLLLSLGIVIVPTLPHVGAIITFILYINSGHDLTPAQAFCIIALFAGRIRPTLNGIRILFRSYFDVRIATSRIQCFTILFVFSLFGYAIRSISLMSTHYYDTKIFNERMASVLSLPELFDRNRGSHGSNHDSLNAAVVCEDVCITRYVPVDTYKGNEKAPVKNQKANMEQRPLSSLERLLGSGGNEQIAFQLNNIHVAIEKGRFIGICGHVGSGKSTFLEAIAGSFQVDKGLLNVYGNIAYSPQQPWIFKGTLRDNVIFGDTFDSVRYYNAIDACCLVNDFAIFPSGDLTITSDNGSNLSGGQKLRISLARAIYHAPSKDIFLLDDTFSGLDGKVGKTIFDRVINNLLRVQKKTILMVTHQMQFLEDCDEILVFSEGTIAERGKHEDLMADNQSQYFCFMSNSSHVKDASHENILLEDSPILDCKPEEMFKLENIFKEEKHKAQGSVPWNIYKIYIQSAGGIFFVLFVLLTFALSIGTTAFSSWWLKNWFKAPGLPPLVRSEIFNSHNETNTLESESDFEIDDVQSNTTDTSLIQVINKDSPDFEFNRNVYAGIIGAIFLTCLLRTLLFVFTTIKASQGLHQNILTRFFSIRLKSFERVGSGQLLNLFSRDMEEIDTNLPNTMELLLQNIFIVLSVFTLVSIVFPSFLGPLLLLMIVFLLIRRVYNVGIRDLKRMESESLSPLFICVTETVSGISTIRAFGKERLLMENFDQMTDRHHSAFYAFNSAVRWLSIRLDTLAVSVTGITAVLILIFHGNVSAAACGLALSYAAQLSGIFQFTVRLASETESKFISVERIDTFLRYSQPEEPDGLPGRQNKSLILENMAITLHPNWPYAGQVKFDAVTLTYSSDALPVLRDISFEILPGQNIGIIGRTGSGKSSIGNALFRLTELKSGQIFVDDVDISTLPLEKLRNSLCVIPQDPAIFQNHIRFNLDPGKLFRDEEIWKVLEKTGLKSVVDSLDSEVGLSQGQQQLLSIARALLRQSKVVFVDEATSNIDVETAAVIDNLLAEEFQSSTIFIVAHRLSALTFCDYILIMEDGEVRDFGPVETITNKPEFASHFERFDSVSLL